MPPRKTLDLEWRPPNFVPEVNDIITVEENGIIHFWWVYQKNPSGYLKVIKLQERIIENFMKPIPLSEQDIFNINSNQTDTYIIKGLMRNKYGDYDQQRGHRSYRIVELYDENSNYPINLY